MAEERISRRDALKRLGLGVVAAYVVPEMISLSAARASSGGSGVSAPSDLSDPSVATPPTPPSVPSNVDADETENADTDHCQSGPVPANNGELTISQSDFERAQAAVDAGYAKPLHQIWEGVTTEYPGSIVGVEFTGYRYRPRYRLRAVSRAGRLETVIVSARTGDIIRIVGC